MFDSFNFKPVGKSKRYVNCNMRLHALLYPCTSRKEVRVLTKRLIISENNVLQKYYSSDVQKSQRHDVPSLHI